MEEAATVPQEGVNGGELADDVDSERLEVFKDFVESLDIEDANPTDGEAED
jgi:hypothetical protein